METQEVKCLATSLSYAAPNDLSFIYLAVVTNSKSKVRLDDTSVIGKATLQKI